MLLITLTAKLESDNLRTECLHMQKKKHSEWFYELINFSLQVYYYKHLAHHARDNIDENTSPCQKRTINTLKTLACMYSDQPIILPNTLPILNFP